MIRVDVFLAQNGYVKSRNAAKELIEGGKVTFDGRILQKPSEAIDENTEHTVCVEADKYVCRGALKLEGALDKFKIDPKNFVCIDIGASTGGFTDLLLRRGAKKVFAVDSGHGQLDPSLCSDERVVNIEGYNARNLNKNDFPDPFDMAVMDVSFISQTYMHKGISELLLPMGVLISLIKPQFEAGRAAVGKGGIVKKREDREAAIIKVLESAEKCGLYCKDIMRSPIDGGDGNIEYLAIFTKNQTDKNIDRAKIHALLKNEGRG